MVALARLTVLFLVSWFSTMPSLTAMAEPLGTVSMPINAAVVRLQAEGEQPQSFVSGPLRVTVIDAVQSPAIEGVSSDATSGTEWVVIVADIANQSDELAEFNLADFALGSGASGNQVAQAVAISDVNLRAGSSTDTAILVAVVEGSTVTVLGEPENGFFPIDFAGQQGWVFGDFLSMSGPPDSALAAPVVDIAASQAAADALDLEVGPDAAIPSGGVERVVAAFPVTAGTQDHSLVIGDALLPLDTEQRAALDPGDLPAITDVPSLTENEFLTVTGSRSLEVQDAGGAVTEIQLIGIDTPTGNECFADEAEAQLLSLVGDGIAVEPTGDAILLWGGTASTEVPTLINHAMVAGGFAAADVASSSPFARWLESAEETARAEERGLWGVCTGVHGTERPQPTPTPAPTPSPAEVRAEYPVLPDVRELAIRPGNMLGERVAFTGSILTIQVAPPGDTFILGDSTTVTGSAAMQVYVVAPDGTQEAVFVVYDGDTSGMFEGTFVTVYGTVEGTQSGTNLMGGEISDPMVKAAIIDFA
jgi:endonuclease YncB( thermonuclease family)